MTGMEVGLISVALILILIYSGMYVPIALGLVSFFSVWYLRGSVEPSIYVLTLGATTGLEDYIYGVIPLFVLMGMFVSQCDLGKDIYEVANFTLRKVKGGLGVATVAANTVFAAVTGVSIASASVFAKVSVPEMLRFGYTRRFAVGVVAGSSVLGMLIPPSVMLIVYAIITEISVADMFKAGILPGLVLAAAYVAGIVVMAVFFPKYIGGQDERSKAFAESQGNLSGREIAAKVAPFVALILLVLGGIYGGLFTPTEAGAVGALGAMVIAMLKRKLSRPVLWNILSETGRICASLLLLIVSAMMYSRMLAISGLPVELGNLIIDANLSLLGVLTLYVLMIVLMGTVLDTTSIILIMVPLFIPVIEPFDVNMIWFGIVTIVAAEIGLLTPPLGISCFVIKSTLSDPSISLGDIFAGAFPFAAIMLLVLILLIAFPWLTLALL